jgi:hypothetical protein
VRPWFAAQPQAAALRHLPYRQGRARTRLAGTRLNVLLAHTRACVHESLDVFLTHTVGALVSGRHGLQAAAGVHQSHVRRPARPRRHPAPLLPAQPQPDHRHSARFVAGAAGPSEVTTRRRSPSPFPPSLSLSVVVVDRRSGGRSEHVYATHRKGQRLPRPHLWR